MKLDIQYFASAGIYTKISKEYTYEQGKILSVKVIVTPLPNDVYTEGELEDDFEVILDGWEKCHDGKGSYYKIYNSNITENLTFEWYSLSIANYRLCAEEEIIVNEIYNFYNLTICIDKQSMTNPSSELKEIELKLLEPLRSLDDISDQLNIDSDGNAKIIRYIEKHLGSLRLKGEPTEEPLENVKIELFEGDNYIYLKDNKQYLIKASYLTNCELNKTFATRLEMNSKFEQTVNGFNLIVSKKVGNDEIISSINQSAEEVKINASKITFEGLVTANENFKILLDGSIEAKNGKFNGNIEGSNIKGSKITGTTIEGNTITGGEINGTTITGGTISGTTINTDKDLTVGNNLYVGNNQSSSNEISKFIYFSDDAFIQRYKLSSGTALGIKSGLAINLYAKTTGYINILEDAISMSHTPGITSDKRLKKEIKNVDVSWIDELNVKEFEYKSTPNKKQIGLIAQDYLGKDYSKYFLNENSNENGEMYYSIAYGNITNALIKYCQELKNEIGNLKKDIENIKGSD